ncbi:MAG: hypothetical protein AB7H80_16585, partial [Candidatus Kapaibacterium sp.]
RYTELAYLDYSSGYRGVMRQWPRYPYEYYETIELVLRMSDEYEKMCEYDLYIHDLDFAQKLRKVYSQYYPKDEWEIVEVCFDKAPSKLDGRFLGYDIASGSYSSILRIILEYQHLSFDITDPFPHLSRDLQDIATEAVGCLNLYKLFDNYETAQEVMLKIGDIHLKHHCYPNHHSFSIGSIYLIDDNEQL